MGCLESKSTDKKEDQEEEQPKTYSWDKRVRRDPKDFMVANVTGETAGRLPGKVNGDALNIQDCKDANIYIFDYSSSIMVDDCIGCTFFLAPVNGSVFFRDCKDCKAVVACQQFRVRDCKKMDIFLQCDTQPIIESSSGMKFGCFQYYYPELEEQFENASLSVYNNNWSNIYDFTPAEGETTWSLLPQDSKVDDYVPLPTTEEFSSIQISTDPFKSIVPVTLGSRRKPSSEASFVIFFDCKNKKQQIREFIRKVQEKGAVLAQTKEVKMKSDEIARVLGSNTYSALTEKGPLVGIEVSGENCIQVCSDSLGTDRNEIYISSNVEKAAKDIDQFYNFIDMSMS